MTHQNRRPDLASLVCVGAISGAHGVSGRLRIKSFCQTATDIFRYQPFYDAAGQREYICSFVGSKGTQLIAEMQNIATRQQAQELKGTRLFAARNRFPATEPDEYYHTDLIGLTVVDGDGQVLGYVRHVVNFGASDVLEVVGDGKRQIQIPFTRSAVPIVDLNTRRVVVDWNEDTA